MPRGVDPEEWKRIEPLLDRVLDADAERRARTLSDVSGGGAVRRAEIEGLVREGERDVPLLDRPAAERFASLLEDAPVRFPPGLNERYRPIRELAHGGMAAVFLARDLKHERDVAVKVMRPDLAASLGRPRFLREIGIAAGLRHPHIVPLFDSGESEGVLWYVMPYEKGHSLRDRLRQEGRVAVTEAVAILGDVCDALAYAHEQGVVHRDIKPENILLAGRHALVTDFGVARAVSLAAAGGEPPTTGLVAGTPPYMAPEAVSVGTPADHRADIYAVGVTAFEMLAGERPGRRPLQELRPDVPPALAALVTRAGAVRLEDRYGSAREVLEALEAIGIRRRSLAWRWRPWHLVAAAVLLAATLGGWLWSRWLDSREASPTGGPPRLAVLPFHVGSVEELEPLALGLTDNLIGALGDTPGLLVRSLSAVLPYGDSAPGVVGQRLDVTWLVFGRVYRLGPEIVASVELTEARTGRLLGRRESRAGSGRDLELIEELVPAVEAMLRERLGQEIRVQGWRTGTGSDAAFAAVNRAYQAREDANRLAALRDIPGAWLGLRRADALLESAARADPRWVEPPIQRARVALNAASIVFGSGELADSLPLVLRQGLGHAEAALRLAPAEPRAAEALGLLLLEAEAFLPADDSSPARKARAEHLLEQAAAADTTMADALAALASIYFAQGRFEEAYVSAERAYQADPFRADPRQTMSSLFTYSFEAGEDAEAARWCAEYARRFSDDWFGGYCRLTLMVWDPATLAHPDTASRIAELSSGLAPRVIRPGVAAQLRTLAAGVLARVGPPAAARRALDDVRAAAASDPAATREPFGSELLELTAAVRVRLGDADSALVLLRELLRRHPERAARLESSRRFGELSLKDSIAPRG